MPLRRTGTLLSGLALATALAGLLPIAAPTDAGDPAPASAAPATAETAAPAGRQRRPNVVVVMADDMRVDDLRFAPRIRRLVGRDGLTFENSFAPYPLCCPSRASFLTGRYAHNHEVFWHTRPYGYGSFDDSRTLGTSMRAAGYRTGYVGKYLNGYGPMRSKVSGTPSWRYVPRGWTDWMAAFENPGVDGIHGGTYYYWDTPYNVNGRVDNRYRGVYQTNVVGDFSVRLARKYHRVGGPFFLYVNYVAPHHGGPREPDDPRAVRDDSGTLRRFATPARPAGVKGRFDELVRRPAGFPRGGGPVEADVSDKPYFFRSLPEPNRAERRALTEVTRQRAESIFVMDRQVARLIRTLKRDGEWRDTVFVFTSDNGYFLGEHRQRSGKVKAHEPSLRVPLLVTGPGMRGGERRYDPVTTLDLSATILDLGDADPPRRPDGGSVLPTMRTGDRGWAVPVVTESTNGRRGNAAGFDDARTAIGLRTPRYSFTRHRNGAVELYDLVEDPLQMQSRHRAPAYAEVRRELTRLWWQLKDCGGPGCRAALPEGLRADAGTNRAWSRAYWRAVRDTYGW